MLLFLLLLLPAALLTYALIIKNRAIILPIFAGIITASVVCACRFFFSFEHHLIYYSFAPNFIYYLVKQNLLSLVIVSAVYALISRDTAEYKIKNFFPLMCSYFAVYLPYCVITSSEFYYQSYDLFLKPVIYLAMLVQISMSLIAVYNGIKERKIICAIINCLLILVYALYPAVSDALYAIDYSFAVILIVGIIYSIFPVVCFFLTKLLKK